MIDKVEQALADLKAIEENIAQKARLYEECQRELALATIRIEELEAENARLRG